MYHHILPLLVVATLAGARSIDNRILGGQNTTIEQHPYQVSLYFITGSHFCGGTLIKVNYVLSAGHCLARRLLPMFVIKAGSTNRKEGVKTLSIERIALHPEFGISTLDFDVSIIKLWHSFNPDASISPINFVPVGQKPRHGEMMTVTGWGSTDIKNTSANDNLLMIRIPVVDNAYCNNIYVDTYNVTDRMFCAGGASPIVISAFKGDSGGPVINEKKELAGLVSWGKHTNMTGRPTVFSDLSNSDIRKFIDKFISVYSSLPPPQSL